MAFLVVVPKSAPENFKILIAKQIWGISNRDEPAQKIKKGAKILFMNGLSYNGKAPVGFPRLKTYNNHPLVFDDIVQAQTTENVSFREKSEFGPRFQHIIKLDFKKMKKWSNIESSKIKPSLLEAVRKMNTGSHRIQQITDIDYTNPML